MLGLASRRYPGLVPPALGKYPGDALWASMVFFGWGIVFPTSSTFRVFIYALVTCYGVEVCKLYQAPWITEVRNSAFGHLIFGSTFSWNNLIAYTVGAALGGLGEYVLLRKQKPASPNAQL
jgi:hypothetical protein